MSKSLDFGTNTEARSIPERKCAELFSPVNGIDDFSPPWSLFSSTVRSTGQSRWKLDSRTASHARGLSLTMADPS